jgi:hypothetical protein
VKPLWSKLTRRQRVLVLIAVAMAALSLLSLLDLGAPDLPLPGTLARETQQVRALRRQVAALEKEERARHLWREELRQKARALWRIEGKTPAVEVQSALEQVARQARITLQNVGAPRTLKLSEHVTAVELSLRLSGSMQEASRFLYELERYQPVFQWTALSLRPDNPRQVRGVVLDGRIRALILAPEAAAVLDPATKKGGAP